MPTQTSTISGVVQAIMFPPVGTLNEALALLGYAMMALGLSALRRFELGGLSNMALWNAQFPLVHSATWMGEN